ncbi:hypothetical protein [Streptomyces sp. NPDC086519]|uniref:hypothetical protein n=1 Tax=Streptomyces sp. NPDC086519 TaxID=3154863 RepID=UPI0034490934
MTIDWIAEAQRLAHGRRFDEFSCPSSGQDSSPAPLSEYEVFQERKTSGAVFIQDNGCGFSTLLVVTGPHRGTMWFDGRATCDQILPLNLEGRPVSFTDWLGRSSMDLLNW